MPMTSWFASLPAIMPVRHGGSLYRARLMGLSRERTGAPCVPGILLSLTCMAALPMLLLTNIPPAVLMIAFGAIVGLSSDPTTAGLESFSVAFPPKRDTTVASVSAATAAKRRFRYQLGLQPAPTDPAASITEMSA